MGDLADVSPGDLITAQRQNDINDYIHDGTHYLNTQYAQIGGTTVIDASRNITNAVTILAVQTSTTGSALSISRDLTSGSTDSVMVSFVQDNASDDQHLLYLQQDGSGSAIVSTGNISTSDYFAATGNNAGLIDLNPSAQGSQNVIDITPTANTTPNATWNGLNINGAALDPATGTACNLHGVRADFSGLQSVTGNASLCAFRAVLPPKDESHALTIINTELTNNVSQIGVAVRGGTLALSATGTYQGMYVDWSNLTRDGNSPVLEGVRIELPADYTNFGANFCAYYSGGGESVKLCDGTTAILSSGNISTSGSITVGAVEVVGSDGEVNAAAIEDVFLRNDGNDTTSGDIVIQGGEVTLGTNTQVGTCVIYDGSSNTITLTAPNVATNYTLTLPTTDGGANEYLKTDGSGALSWDTPDGMPTSTVQYSGIFADGAGDWSEDTAFKVNSGRITACIGADIVQTATSGYALDVSRDLASGSSDSALVYFNQDNVADDMDVLSINQDGLGAGKGINIIADGTGSSIYIDHNGDTGTSGALTIENTGNDGKGLHVISANTGAVDNPLVTFESNHTGFDQTILQITQDGAGTATGIGITQNGSGVGLTVNKTAGSTSHGAMYVINTGNVGPGIDLYTNMGSAASYALLYCQIINSAFDQPGIGIANAGTGNGIYVNQTGQTENGAIYVTNANDGPGLKVASSNDSTQDKPLVQFHGTNSGFDWPILEIYSTGDVGSSKGTLYLWDNNTDNDNVIYHNPSGAKLTNVAGVWTDKASWRGLKEDLNEITPDIQKTILENIDDMEIYTYFYKGSKKRPHDQLMGPMMDDTDEYLTPGKYLENGEKNPDASISAKNGYGYAFAAIKGLLNEVKDLKEQVAILSTNHDTSSTSG